jgi:hypothetical protein
VFERNFPEETPPTSHTLTWNRTYFPGVGNVVSGTIVGWEPGMAEEQNQLSTVVLSLIANIFGWKTWLITVLGIVFAFLGWVYLLPPEKRSEVPFDSVLTAISGPTLWILTGALLAITILALLAVSYGAIKILMKRVRRQGEELKEPRALADPERMSSDDLNMLKRHAEKVRDREEKE